MNLMIVSSLLEEFVRTFWSFYFSIIKNESIINKWRSVISKAFKKVPLSNIVKQEILSLNDKWRKMERNSSSYKRSKIYLTHK